MLDKDFLSAVKACWNILINSSLSVKLSFLAACLLDLITVFMSVAAPAVLKILIDSLSAKEAVAEVAWLGAVYGATWLGAELLLRLRGVLAAIVVEKIKFEATKRFCVNSIFKLEVELKESPSGVFATRLSQTNNALPMFIDGVVWQIVPLLVRLILSVSVLVHFSSLIYASLLAATVLIFVVISLFSYKGIGERQKFSNLSAQSTYWRILDALKNRTIIIAHADERAEFKHIEKALLASTKSAIGVVNFSQAISSLQIMVLGAGLTAITVFAARDLAGGVITAGDFVQINAYVLQFVLPVSYVGMVLSAIKRTSVTIAENAEHLVQPCVLIDDPKEVQPLPPPVITLNKVCIHSLDGKILLKDISVVIESGSSLAVVGNSGAGKSTLAKALLGLVEVSAGVIKYDSQELSGEAIRALRKHVGYVPQDTFLFDRSVKDNVFGDLLFDQAEIPRILRVSGIDDDKGLLECNACHGLSGGEKQRVSFARAIARYPNVIVLDEPTSSLDKATKKILSSAIYAALNGVTRIIITHDLVEASKADKIIVMDNGTIVELGTHLSLLDTGGWYAKHYTLSKAVQTPRTEPPTDTIATNNV
ncbi:ABC transporter ATP-binding protein [Pseudomonas sp. D2-30]|uniref:ABC transporter ATP-binding protein n=1 Tax=unclassified Pseudomonas TaxID=196821 RepID=UPI003DA7E369